MSRNVDQCAESVKWKSAFAADNHKTCEKLLSQQVQWVYLQFGANVFLTRSREEREEVRIPLPKHLLRAKARKSHKKSFSFAFFAASREENLLSKSAPRCGCPQAFVEHT